MTAAALPLPSGAATSAAQGTMQTSLSSIDNKTPALGQALAAASQPVVLTAAQQAALTPPAAITGFSTEATLAAIKAKTDNLDVLLSTRTKPADTQQVTVGNFPATQVTTASDILTKGTQAATGFSVQNLKDAGRSIKTYSAIGVAGVVAEAMLTLQAQSDGTNGATGTSFSVTAGKRFRAQQLICCARTGAAAANWSRFVLRMSASGAVTIASPVTAVIDLPAPAAALGVGQQPTQIPLPDGLELSGTQQFGLSHIALAATNIESVTLIGYEY